MPKTKIPSPARSQGATTPKRKKSRGSRSVCSPALSTASGRLTSLIDQFKEKNMESFALSPLNRRSILNDDTAIEEPRRQSWWKKLKEDSHEIMEVLEENKVADSGNNAIEELIDIEVLSQEKKEYTLDLPESSDNESINSIVLPQRKLFTQKENKPQKKFGQFSDNRETLAKLHKTNTQGDKTVNVGTRELFQNAKRSKPIFPAALLNISPNKTAMDKTKENILPEPKVRNIFGNRPANKRKNMFADFVVSESEDEIPELQPRVFGFQKKLEQRRISSISKGREGSPASSITTDMEMDDWKLLPSSTMVENQLEDIVAGHTPKRARLSKLSEAKESEAGTLQTNTTGDKTKSSNKSIMSKNKSKSSPDMKDKSLNSSRTTRSMLKNASKLEEKTEPKQDTKTQSKISTKDNELDVSSSKATKQNTSMNKSLRLNKSRTRNSSKLNEEEMETDENVVKNAINDATRVISKNASSATVASKSINEKERTITLKVHDKASETGSNKEEDENNFVLQYEDEIIEEATNHNEINENKTSKIKNRNTIVIEKDQETDVNESKSNKSVQKESKQAKTVEESVESQNEQSGNDNIDGNEVEELAIEENHESDDGEKISRELNEESNNSEGNDERNVTEDNEDQENDEEMNESQEHDEEINLSQESNRDEAVLSRVDEENESEVNEENENEDDVNESNESEEQNESQEVEAEVDESQEIEEQNESQEIENEANESQEVNEEADDSKVEENASEDEEENQEVENDEEEENVEESQEVDNEESQEIENQDVEHEVSQESEQEVSQEVENEEENEEENDEEDQEVEQDVENQSEDDIEDQVEDQSQEVENDEENDEEENEESQEIENDEENQAESEAEVNESQEIENDQEMDDSDEADRAIASDPEISDQDDNGADEMEVDDDDNNEQESENEEETEGNQEESQEEQQEPSAEEIEESPNVTHDTTGRHRQKVLKSPEAILHDKTNQMDSFTAKGRNTSIRKTKSMIKNLNIRPSLAPQRDSLAFSDGTRDSSAEGSGWDSHRTTRKTLRQTFGKDFTPRKSLRALVMEKSAKRQTEHMDLHSETSKYPQANSTELPEDSNGHVEDFVESDHEVSRRTRQTTLETYLQKIKQKNLENKVKMEELVRNSLKAPARDTLSLFKVPNKPAPRRLKPTQNKPRTQVKAITAFGELPTEVIEDMKYKPPKRFQPTNASWITKRLYKFLETKLEPKYDYKARVRAEKLVETIYHFAKDLRRHDVAPTDAVDVLKHELARLEVVQTHFEFYEFFHEFMPREVRVKVVPDIVNKIPLPRHGVFSDILRGNNVQG
ncbi:putative leucine-rich repeat-containing protein DDB_G0290503 [Spodoptera frugiperda]|uniref:Leucine-rich repeat-containing protein DDB_G0290503 n=1 Tax=Spodoptera frugiperda TaxID=7108 RepID=A0A9R0D9F4_SPOFR|nr:putative leucine-rich repeat-containing protein DDB_G0290503 [Spodoptera frugiperda]